MNMATLSTLAKLDPATDPYPTEPAIDRHPQLNQAANWAEAESLILVTDGDPNSSQYGRYVLLPNWIPEAQQHKVAKHLFDIDAAMSLDLLTVMQSNGEFPLLKSGETHSAGAGVYLIRPNAADVRHVPGLQKGEWCGLIVDVDDDLDTGRSASGDRRPVRQSLRPVDLSYPKHRGAAQERLREVVPLYFTIVAEQAMAHLRLDPPNTVAAVEALMADLDDSDVSP